MTVFQIVLKAYGQANERVKALSRAFYFKTPEERLELDRQYGQAIRDAVRAKAALDALLS